MTYLELMTELGKLDDGLQQCEVTDMEGNVVTGIDVQSDIDGPFIVIVVEDDGADNSEVET